MEERTAELREREDVLQRVTGSAQDAIIMIDDTDRVVLWNAAAGKLFGYKSDEIPGQKMHPLLMPSHYREQQEPAFAHFVHTGEGAMIDKTAEVFACRRDGSEFPIDLSLSAVEIKGKWCGIGIVRDATERKGAEVALELLATTANTDTLTGIANRRGFNTALEAEINRAERHDLPLT